MKLYRWRAGSLLTIALLGAALLRAGDDAAPTSNEQLAQLRALLAAQQTQLETLRLALQQQQLLLEKALDEPSNSQQTLRPNPGSVAILTPVVPVPAPATVALPSLQSPFSVSSANPCEAPPDSGVVPLYLRLGGTCIVPVGFLDLIGVWRDKNAASGIGTNYASIPYNNVTAGKLSEFRFSPQNSRLGFRADGEWKGAHFMAYNEFDFLGTSGTNNLGVSNGAFVPRLRLFWVDVRKGRWEILGGQSWSLLTPNRQGLSALPGDLFYSQAIDVNYISGLTWTRQPGVRVIYHPNHKLAVGVSFENPDQYMGGSGGFSATAVTLPAASALSGIGGTQVDNSTNVLNTPNVIPDIIAKVAFDPNARFHFEAGGVARTFKVWDSAPGTDSTKEGGGALVGANVALLKNLRAITSNFWSDGGGRYLFGQAPDFIVRANGAISPVHAGGTVDGFEAAFQNLLLYVYYGGIYIGRDTAFDANGTSKIGYGFAGSSNIDNRAIQELTFGFNRTLWKDPRYGALNVMGQYEWLLRDPWAVLAGTPKATHDNTVYADFRYTLPGAIPVF